MIKEIVIKHIGKLLIAFFFAIALFTYTDHGITYDEPTQRIIGKYNYDLLVDGDTTLFRNHFKYYGSLFETPLYLVELLTGITSEHDIYNQRHLVAHLYFLIGAFYLFSLIDLQYNNKWLAAIGLLFYVLHPRIYAHSFFNTKDVVFLSTFSICLYLVAVTMRRQKWWHWLLLGLFTGYLMNLRIVGLILLAGVLGLLFIEFLRRRSVKLLVSYAALYICVAFMSLYASFPFMWGQPVDGFMELLQVMSKFIWNGEQLFKGEMVRAVDLPWDYIPVWFSITTPVVNLGLGLIGIALLVATLVKDPYRLINDRIISVQVLYLMCLLLPVVMVIVMHSVLYGAWRHLFFIYVPFVLLAVFGLNRLIQFKHMHIPVLLLTIGSLVFTGFNIVQLYPLSQVYFNLMVDKSPSQLGKQFEMDYWGASYKPAFEYILANDPADSITVAVATAPGINTYRALPPNFKRRLHIVPVNRASYFIKQYSWRMDFPPTDDVQLSEWYTITRYNSPVIGIFQVEPVQ